MPADQQTFLTRPSMALRTVIRETPNSPARSRSGGNASSRPRMSGLDGFPQRALQLLVQRQIAGARKRANRFREARHAGPLVPGRWLV